MATNKIMIVILGALVFCLGSARPGLAAQADPPGKKPPPAPTAPIFTLLDNNGNQVGTVVGFLGSGRVMTRVPVQDSRAVTHNIGLLVSQNFIFSTGQSLFFQSVDCSGTPFILVNTANANPFLPAFEVFFLGGHGTLVIPTSNVPQALSYNSVLPNDTESCVAISNVQTVVPGEFVGNISDMFPPPYTLVAK